MSDQTADQAIAGDNRADFFGADAERVKDVAARAAELLRRAILTDAALPAGIGPDMGRCAIPAMSAADRIAAFGHEAAMAHDAETRELQRRRAERFKPSSADIDRYLDVLAWLAWLKRQDAEGREGVGIIRSRAFKLPWWRIGQRIGVSADTASRRHLAAVTRIAAHFWREIDAMG